MFTAFDENKFRQAIREKDFIRLKTDTISTMLNDPSFSKGETMQVIGILQKEVPEIFEEETVLGYEERLEPSQWDKRYFRKLVYYFEKNFAISRITYIEEVGKAISPNAAPSPAMKKTKETCKVTDMIAQIKKEGVKIPVQEDAAPVLSEKIIEEKPAEIPVIPKPAKPPVQQETVPAKPVANPTPAPKKKSKLPVIIAAVAAAAVVAVVLIIGFFR